MCFQILTITSVDGEFQALKWEVTYLDLGLSTSKIMLKEISCERSEDSVHLVKYSPCKHEKLHWIPRTQVKRPGVATHTFNFDESQMEVYYPDSLT